MSWLFATAFTSSRVPKGCIQSLSMVVHAEGILWIHMLAASAVVESRMSPPEGVLHPISTVTLESSAHIQNFAPSPNHFNPKTLAIK